MSKLKKKKKCIVLVEQKYQEVFKIWGIYNSARDNGKIPMQYNLF